MLSLSGTPVRLILDIVIFCVSSDYLNNLFLLYLLLLLLLIPKWAGGLPQFSLWLLPLLGTNFPLSKGAVEWLSFHMETTSLFLMSFNLLLNWCPWPFVHSLILWAWDFPGPFSGSLCIFFLGSLCRTWVFQHVLTHISSTSHLLHIFQNADFIDGIFLWFPALPFGFWLYKFFLWRSGSKCMCPPNHPRDPKLQSGNRGEWSIVWILDQMTFQPPLALGGFSSRSKD